MDRPPRVLHVWDTRVDSGSNIDDLLGKSPIVQESISRVLIRNSRPKPLTQQSQYVLNDIQSPFPKGVLRRIISKRIFTHSIEEAIERFNPDILFFHFGQTAATYIKLAMKYKKPFVVGIYGHDVSVATQSFRWKMKYRIFAKTDGKYLVLAKNVVSRLVSIGIKESNIFLYDYPLNIEPYLRVQKRQLDRTSSSFRITIPGRFVEKKGHKYLFEALQILNEMSVRVSLTAIGYGDKENLEREAKELGIGSLITWVDTGDATVSGDFDAIYSSVLKDTDLVVLPCLTSKNGDNEAGPALVLCLAQATGTPVLTTPFEGHEVSIKDCESGLIIPERNSQAIAEKILWAINNPIALSNISNSGRETVVKVFSLSSNVEKILHVLFS